MDGTLTNNTTLSQGGRGSNGNEEGLSKSSGIRELEFHY